MREATNLSWTDTPFGAARRPFAERTSLLAAFSVMATIPPAAAAVYLRLPRAHTLPVTDTTLRFGFHAVAAEHSAEALVVVTTLDALLVQARRQAAILAGDRLADELALLVAGHGQPTRGITAVTAAWRGTTAETRSRTSPRHGERTHTSTAGSHVRRLPPSRCTPPAQTCLPTLYLRAPPPPRQHRRSFGRPSYERWPLH